MVYALFCTNNLGMKKRHKRMVVPETSDDNFGFAFNDLAFSDRALRILIIPDESSDSRGKKHHHGKDSKTHYTGKGKKTDSGSCDGAKVVTLHITSAILAAKSPFFYKLFTNGMRESQQRNHASLTINACEEAAFMELINFMYGSTLSATSAADLINVLVIADKFEVTSCMKHVIRMLLELPMSLENALVYLELPSSVLVSKIVKPLIDEAKECILTHYKDFTKSKEKAISLPLSAIEVVLGSEGLHVHSEDDVYDFILEWARVSYPKPKERREVLANRLTRLVCFRSMSISKLKEALACPDFDHEHVSMLVAEALFAKVDQHGQHIQTSNDLATNKSGSLGRVYSPHCVVYFDLRRDECAALFAMKRLYSPIFCLGGQWLYLVAQECGLEQHHLGLFVGRAGPGKSTIDFEFQVMKNSSKVFERKFAAKNVTLEDHGRGVLDLLGIPWTEFMSYNSDYFVDGILRIRASITLINNNS